MIARFFIFAVCLLLAVCEIGGGTGAAQHAEQAVPIPQGWSSDQKGDWYTRSQGSRLIPLSWLLALEQDNSQSPFLEATHIEKYRYLPHSSRSPQSLPIGFTRDTTPDDELSATKLRWKRNQSNREPWVGMNCAACHTAEITFQRSSDDPVKRMRIEGGPTIADFQGFMKALDRALIATRDDTGKYDRFAAAVLKGSDTPENRQMLAGELRKLLAWEQKVRASNNTPLAYGFGRLDAFGHIFNKVALVAEADQQTFHPADAPVSYPFLWNVPQHKKVQWNGIVENKRVGQYDIGALGRNVGEVVGVFADIKLSSPPPRFPPSPLPGFVSSAAVGNLNVLEEKLRTLEPPAWPASVFGRIDPAQRELGRRLFNGERPVDGRWVKNPEKSCARCHHPLSRKDLRTPIKSDETMTPLREAGTDIWMACNAYTRTAKTGLLEGTRLSYLRIIPGDESHGDKSPIAKMLKTTVAGTIWRQKEAVVGGVLSSLDVFDLNLDDRSLIDAVPSLLPPHERPVRTPEKQSRRDLCLSRNDSVLAYKARPLTGIWATAPYLHNGSVPTLYDLLLPPADRPKEFYVGSRLYDAEKVGYITTKVKDDDFLFQTRDSAGRMIDGNSNAGHDYGNAEFSTEDRMALVEYMKGL
jgi:processive rubber oxygenase RoxA-like protein